MPLAISPLHAQLLLVQRHMRRARISASSELSPLVTNLVPIIATRPGAKLTELARFLGVAPSNLSRLLKDLRKQGLLSTEAGAESGSSKAVTFTPKGKILLTELIDCDNRIVRSVLGNLKESDLSVFSAFFDSLATAFGADQEVALAGETELVRHQKRLARTMGMVGGSYLNTEVDVGLFQVLTYLANVAEPTRFTEIARYAPIEMSSLSRLLSKLAEQGTVQRIESGSDGRSVLFSLTRNGKARILALSESAERTLAPPAKRVSSALTKRFMAIVESALTGDEEDRDMPELPQLFEVRKAENNEERRAARAFVMETLVLLGRHRQLSETLLPRSATILVARDPEGKIHGIASSHDPEKGREGDWFLVRPTSCQDAVLGHLRERWQSIASPRRQKRRNHA